MALLATVERVLNRHISESTAATRRLGALEGQSFAVAIAGPDIRIVLNVRDGHVHVRVSADEPVDATVRGSPLALLGLLNPGSLSRLRTSNVELAGKVHVAEEFAEMLRHARDGLLRNNVIGELAVEAYYTFGPALAGLIQPSEELRGVARGVLSPVIAWVRELSFVELAADSSDPNER